MNKYLQIRTAKAGPVFIHFEGQSLTRHQFITILKQCLDIMVFDSSYYYSHSFRIGAAAIPALQGVDSNAIQGSGRWFSNAFCTFIR